MNLPESSGPAAQEGRAAGRSTPAASVASGAEVVLRVRDLRVRYPRLAHPAPDGCDLDLRAGERVLLLGPSGSGKSTLLLALTGLIPHDIFAQVQGTLWVLGADPGQEPPGAMATRIGLMFQDPEAGFAMLVVEDEIAFGLENLRVPPAAMPPRITAALRAVGMEAYRWRRLDSLSGGQQQRVALAALLAMEPPILALDEPTAHLDPQGTAAFFATLGRLRDAHSVLLVEHRVDQALAVVDRVVLLDARGRVLAQGPPRATLRRHRDAALAAGLWLPEDLDPRAGWRAEHTTRLRTDPPALALEGVSFAYPQGPPVVQEVHLQVPQGDFLALVGPNGAGKTTLARLMLHLGLRPSAGQVRLFGDPVAALTPRQITARAGFVFQNPEHQFVTDRVDDEIAYGLRARGLPEPEVQARVRALLRRFGLEALAAHNPFRLSQGQKRRLSVATMLAVAPRLLILDEPTFGQDRNTAYALMDLLLELNREGITIVMITHDTRLVRQYARHVAVLERGRLVWHGPASEWVPGAATGPPRRGSP